MASVDDCPVCLAELAPGARCVLACDHAFCVECVVIIVAKSGPRGRSNAARCPVCRRAIVAFLDNDRVDEAWARLRAAWDSKAVAVPALSMQMRADFVLMHMLRADAEAAVFPRRVIPRVSWWKLALAHAFALAAFGVANTWERMGRMGRMSPVALVFPLAPVALRFATVLPLVRATIPRSRTSVRMRRRLAISLTAMIAVRVAESALRRSVLLPLVRSAGPFLLFRGIERAASWVCQAA